MQKRKKVGNLLSLKMKKRNGWIDNVGNDRKSEWILTDKGVAECKRNNPKCKRTCKRKPCRNLLAEAKSSDGVLGLGKGAAK